MDTQQKRWVGGLLFAPSGARCLWQQSLLINPRFSDGLGAINIRSLGGPQGKTFSARALRQWSHPVPLFISCVAVENRRHSLSTGAPDSLQAFQPPAIDQTL